MPITPYVRPQETITQILRATPAPAVIRRNPLVIGPQYILANFDVAHQFKQNIDTDGAGNLTYSYEKADGTTATIDALTHTIDQDSVKVYGLNLEATVSDTASPMAITRGTGTVCTKIIAATTTFFTGASRGAALNGRDVQIGDIVYVTVGATTVRRTVVGFETNGVTADAKNLILNGNIPGADGAAGTVVVRALFSGLLNTDVLVTNVFTVGSSDVAYTAPTLKGTLFGLTTGENCAVYYGADPQHFGKLVVSFRAVQKVSELDGVITINSLSDLTQLGDINAENWLAYGAYEAFKGTQSAKIFVLRTGGDSVAEFQAALDKVRSTDYYYALVPLTDRDDVKELVAAHCDEMSNKYNRNFRRCYVGTDSPGAFQVWGTKSDGTYREATVDATNKRILIETGDQSVSNFVTDLSVGDTVVLEAGTNNISVTISHIVSAAEVVYTGTYAGATTNVKLTATRKDSAANVVKFFSERNIGSRRCVNVWSDSPVTYGAASQGSSYNSTVMPMKFVAAEIAGIRCALLPQQGLTMTEVLSVDAAPSMYTRFTPEQLDAIAAQGVLIVTQEIEGGEMFIRHQLTTATDLGALAYEDNIGVIVDEFSYRVKDLFRGYLGRRNVTRDTIAEMRIQLNALATAAMQETLANKAIGPMVLRYFDEDGKEGDVTVRVDDNLADHIVTYVKLRVPLPINGLDHYIDVETSVEL